MDFKKKLEEIVFNYLMEYRIDKEEDIKLFATKLAKEISNSDFIYDVYSKNDEINKILEKKSTSIFNKEDLEKIDTRVATYIATSNILSYLEKNEELSWNLMDLYNGNNMERINIMKDEYIFELIEDKAEKVNDKLQESNYAEKIIKKRLTKKTLNEAFMGVREAGLHRNERACLRYILSEEGYNAFINEIVNNINKTDNCFYVEDDTVDKINEYLTLRGMRRIPTLTFDEIEESLDESKNFGLATRNCDETEVVSLVNTSIVNLRQKSKKRTIK